VHNRNIIVTGAKGFIGSVLVEKLAKNNTVFGIDNLIHAPNKHEVAGVKYFDCDASEVSSISFNEKIDYFFHLGEYSRVEQSFEEPIIAFQNTVEQMPAVLDFCLLHGIKLVYSASSTKYANYYNSNASPYARFKKINTKMITNFASSSNLEYAIAYFYNVYGPTESKDHKYGTVIAKYMELCNNGAEDLPVTLPGTQVRNFTHVDDTIEGLLKIALIGSGDGYGIGSDEAYSILDVVKMFGKKPKFLPEKLGNRQNAELITEKTKALGWRPKRSLKKYIEESLK